MEIKEIESYIENIIKDPLTFEKLPEEVAKYIKNTKKFLFTVILDCDSTVINAETNDEILAGIKSVTDVQKQEIEALTNRGMDPTDEMEQSESMKKRFDIAKPEAKDFENYGKNNRHRITDEVRNFIEDVRARGGQVLVISGGNKEAIDPLLEDVVPEEDIHANIAKKYFKTKNVEDLVPICKVETIKNLKKSKKIPSNENHKIVMVGDGGSDLEVFQKGLADIFLHAKYFEDRSAMTTAINNLSSQKKEKVIKVNNLSELKEDIFDNMRNVLQKTH